MAGVVGGDVGRGTFTGEVFSIDGTGQPGDPTFIHAHYHFNGRFHSFTADVHVTQILNKAVIIGVVSRTGGWRATSWKGNTRRSRAHMMGPRPIASGAHSTFCEGPNPKRSDQQEACSGSRGGAGRDPGSRTGG